MRTWMSLSTPQIKEILDEQGVSLSGVRGTKAQYAAQAEALLGPDPDNPVLVQPAPARDGQGALVEAYALLAEPVPVEYQGVQHRIAAVIADLPAIGKDSTAPANMGGYAYRGIEAITAALKPLLARHGLVMIPTVIERDTSQRSTKGGGTLYVVDLLIRFTFVGVDGDELVAEMWGQGTDAGDKATQKAVTSAFKSMLAVVFCIADSETDAEAHDVPDSEPKPEFATAEDLALIGQWMAKVPAEHREAATTELREKFGPSTELAYDRVGAVIDWIEAKIATLKPLPSSTPTEGTVPCPECEGTGLTLNEDEGHEEVICPLCEGTKVVCSECLAPLTDHLPDCSRIGTPAP